MQNSKFPLFVICKYVMSGIFIFSGISKIIDPIPVIEVLNFLKWFPEDLNILLATMLPIVELSIAVMLLMNYKLKLTLLFSLMFFSGFLLFSIYGTLSGMSNDCGCFGSLVQSKIGWGMVIRNFIFTLISAVAYFAKVEPQSKNIEATT